MRETFRFQIPMFYRLFLRFALQSLHPWTEIMTRSYVSPWGPLSPILVTRAWLQRYYYDTSHQPRGEGVTPTLIHIAWHLRRRDKDGKEAESETGPGLSPGCHRSSETLISSEPEPDVKYDVWCRWFTMLQLSHKQIHTDHNPIINWLCNDNQQSEEKDHKCGPNATAFLLRRKTVFINYS